MKQIISLFKFVQSLGVVFSLKKTRSSVGRLGCCCPLCTVWILSLKAAAPYQHSLKLWERRFVPKILPKNWGGSFRQLLQAHGEHSSPKIQPQESHWISQFCVFGDPRTLPKKTDPNQSSLEGLMILREEVFL